MFLPVFYSLDITIIETANQYCCLQPADSQTLPPNYFICNLKQQMTSRKTIVFNLNLLF